MADLDSTLVRNLTEAYRTSDEFARVNDLDLWDVRDVMTTMLVTESGGGYIYANGGQGFQEPEDGHTPWNWDSVKNREIGTPASRAKMRATLRRSLDIPHDRVGNNGRSTGPAQQLSADTGGNWGPMAATMSMDLSMRMFLDAVDWSDRSPVYKGKPMANWQTAMLLRVQQPLPSEVQTNYGAGQLAAAKAIARDERFAPATDPDWITMSTPDEVKVAFGDAVDPKFADLKAYLVSGNVMDAQAKAIMSFDTGQGSTFAAQLAEIMRLLQVIAAKQ